MGDSCGSRRGSLRREICLSWPRDIGPAASLLSRRRGEMYGSPRHSLCSAGTMHVFFFFCSPFLSNTIKRRMMLEMISLVTETLVN